MYDDVSLICTSYPYIENVQVAPDIYKNEITIQSVILNKPGTKQLSLTGTVKEWKSGKVVSSVIKKFETNNNNRQLISFNIPVTEAILWSPQNPFLYCFTLSTGVDDYTARFGMREFRFDTPTKRAYLNNKLIFLRGSNITLHRFFDDSLCRNHPWDEKWVRTLLTDLPKKYSWNTFRFCIGPVPDKWFEIADEAGLIIQNEYFIWSYRPYWNKDTLKSQLIRWMNDCWNHPSVAWWDICNETREPILTGLISEIRHLDLSNRAWDNGYNLPEGENDPVEDHHYKWYAGKYGPGLHWKLKNFQEGTGEKSTNSPHPSAHACVLNEYGWLWLKRNGQYTNLTKAVYDSIAPGATNNQRQELYSYLLAVETEYFRAHRNYAGVMHFDYLTGDFNGAITGDIFKNPETLEPVQAYDDYLSEIFKPLGVYVNFFPDRLASYDTANVPIMIIQDDDFPVNGILEVKLVNDTGSEIEIVRQAFKVGAFSQTTVNVKFPFNAKPGAYWLNTVALHGNNDKTLSRRKITLSTAL
ncbi:MAG: hypothetical protein HC905_02520 [Bacteroidales bacterium]|nr:hypothetical protein [Bacteroidales bacterium]